MSETKKFRTALNGFNRQDVVQYIEYLNNRNRSQVQQLNDQLKAAKEAPNQEISRLEARIAELEDQLEAKDAEIAALQTQPAVPQPVPAVTQPVPAVTQPAPQVLSMDQELEAYRRAERAERQAHERARMVYERANAVLADVTVQADEYARAMDLACAQLIAALDTYKTAVALSRPKLDEATRTLATIRTTE